MKGFFQSVLTFKLQDMSYVSAVCIFFFAFIALPSFVKFGSQARTESVTDFVNVLIPLLIAAAFIRALAF